MQFLLPVVYKNNIDFPNCSSLQTEVTYSMTSNNANVYVENKEIWREQWALYYGNVLLLFIQHCIEIKFVTSRKYDNYCTNKIGMISFIDVGFLCHSRDQGQFLFLGIPHIWHAVILWICIRLLAVWLSAKNVGS